MAEPQPTEAEAEEAAQLAANEAESDESGFSDAFKQRSADENAELANADEAVETDATDDETLEASETPPAAKAGDQSGTSPEDPLAGMTDAQRERWLSLEQSERSQRGRIAALTKKLNTKAEPAPKPALETAKDDPAPAEGDQSGNEDDSSTDLKKRLDQAIEDYPDAVGPFAELIDDLKAQISDLSQKVQPITDAQDTDRMTEAYTTLEENHPDYLEVAQDDSFQAWAADQPNSVRAMVNSFDPKEVSIGLTLYKAERAKAEAESATDPSEAVNQATDAKRERQLEGSKQVSSKGVPATSGTPNDFRAAFKARSKAIADGRA